MKYLIPLLILFTSCGSLHTDWDYKNNNPYKKKFKHKPNYEDYNYGHRPGQWETKFKKKNKVKY
jgi:hypothetical protein